MFCGLSSVFVSVAWSFEGAEVGRSLKVFCFALSGVSPFGHFVSFGPSSYLSI